jgi:hypothetical protein
LTPQGAAQQRLERRKLRLVRDHKIARGCKVCGLRDHRMLDLDHREPETKHPYLKKTMTVGWRKLSYDDLVEELEKCDVLCANHHRLRTWEQQQHPAEDY